MNIVLAAANVDGYRRVAALCGFDVLPDEPGRWPTLVHKETGVRVDILPEDGRPGTVSRPAPTTIPHPSTMGARAGLLLYIDFEHLLKRGKGVGCPHPNDFRGGC